MRLRTHLFTFLMLCLTALPILAQLDTGTITGTVRDSSGATVPNAQVSVRSVATDQAVELTASDQGVYVSPPLRPGQYTVTITAQGFEKIAKRLQLDVSQRAVVDFDLKLGAITQEVAVVDATPVLQTETVTLSNLRSEKTIRDLPLNGRNFAQLLQLSAGVMPAQTQTTGSPITMKRGVTGNSVNGTRLEENNYLVDGINNTENHNGLGILIFPSVDAIAEFRVEASVSDAQFGRGGGGTVNLIYKSGSKDFHGNLYEFFRNSALDAKNYFDRATDPIPPFKQNQFGGTLGGPVLPWTKEKNTFFFFSYEGTRVRQAQTLISSVPTEAFRNGDFSAAPQRIFDPLTQTTNGPEPVCSAKRFRRNRIPANRIDPVGRNLLESFPTCRISAPESRTISSSTPSQLHGNKFDLKIDHPFSQQDTGSSATAPAVTNWRSPASCRPRRSATVPASGPEHQPVHQVVASETHIFSPSLTTKRGRAGRG